MREITMKVPDMTCEHCEKRIRDAVVQAGGTVKELDLASKKLVITIDMTDTEAAALLDDTGYDALIV